MGGVAHAGCEAGGAVEIPGEIGDGLGVDFGEPPDSGEDSGDQDR